MSHIHFIAMPTAEARYFQAGGCDAYGLAPERRTSDGDGVPCRHYTLSAPTPAAAPGLYLHGGGFVMRELLAKRKAHLIKGYGQDDRIVYGTGQIVVSAELETEAAKVLAREDVAYVHVRSAVNNCYTCRVERT